MQVKQFGGPLFVVGMPRSGTKLLREMLNRHPRVRFSEIETQFFPYWVSQRHKFAAIDRFDNFEAFYSECSKSPFFIQLSERGHSVDCLEWFGACDAFTPAAVFEGLLRCVLKVPRQSDELIWGDKSPSYLRHVPLLMDHFPKARIIHIVRDVRDYCLSINKAWGKSMLRAAQRWQDDVSKCREDGRRFPSSYMELRFEDLLVDPPKVLADISRFVGIEFDEQMLTPGSQTEKVGEARGVSGILTNNWGKYQSRMSPKMVIRIEKVACPSLRALDYPCSYSGPAVRLSPVMLLFLKWTDGLSLLQATIGKRGLIGSFKYRIEQFRTSGNRFHS